MRTRSPSNAPPENGDDGSTASTPTRLPVGPQLLTSTDVDVDLPTPGEPVRPTTCACPTSADQRRGDVTQTPASRSRPARSAARPRGGQLAGRSTRARRGPGCRRSGGPRRSRDAQDECISLTATAAQRRSAGPPPRRLSSRASVSASRAPDMPIGWPSAMAPPLTLTMSSRRRGPSSTGCHGRECFVDLDQVEIAHRQSGLARARS